MKLLMGLVKNKIDKKYNSDGLISENIIQKLEDELLKNPKMTTTELQKLYFKEDVLQGTFKSFKHRLEFKLINDLFTRLNAKETLERRSMAKPMVQKLAAVAMAIQKTGDRELGLLVFEKVLFYAKRYEFYDLAISACNAFMFHYGLIEPKKKLYESYSKQIELYNEIFYSENQVFLRYVKVLNIMVQNSGSFSIGQQLEIERLKEEMNVYTNKHRSFLNLLYTTEVNYDFHFAKAEYKLALNVAQGLLKELEQTKNDEILINFSCHKNIGIAHFHLMNYEKAMVHFDKCINLTSVGYRYWFYTHSYRFICLGRLGQINELIHLTIQVLRSTALKNFTSDEQLWKIREAYVNLLVQTGQYTDNVDQKFKLPSFSINRFVNEVPIFSKDKTGQNINILVIQIQFLLLEKKYGKILDLKESLEMYSSRYLKKNNYFRAQCFIKMVLLASKANFHPFRTRKFTSTLYNKLVSENLRISENEPQFEIIPYDLQWKIILDILDRNHQESAKLI